MVEAKRPRSKVVLLSHGPKGVLHQCASTANMMTVQASQADSDLYNAGILGDASQERSWSIATEIWYWPVGALLQRLAHWSVHA